MQGTPMRQSSGQESMGRGVLMVAASGTSWCNESVTTLVFGQEGRREV